MTQSQPLQPADAQAPADGRPAAISPAAASSTLDTACANGVQLQLAGQLGPAAQIYTAILQAAPLHAAANYCLGMLHVQSQRPAEGLPYLKTALEAQLDSQDYWLGYLEALTLLGRIGAARNILALGRRQGLAGPAVEEFARRLEQQPAAQSTSAAAPPIMIAAPATKRTRKQSRDRRREIRRAEDALLSLLAGNKVADTLAYARSVTERFPDCGLGWKILAALMPAENDSEEIIAIMRTAVRLLPRDAEAYVNLGITLARAKRPQEGETYLHKAIELDPSLAAAHFRLAVAYELQGRYAEAEASLRRGRALGSSAMSVARDDELSFSHMLFFMGHNPAVDADSLASAHRQFGEYFEGPLRASWPRHANDRDPKRSLAVGFVSGDFYNHSVSKFLEPVLGPLAALPGVQIHGYYNNTREDDATLRLRACCKQWNLVSDWSDAQMADRIMQDRIDVLIDLSGHTGLNRLPVFARKPAPIQVSWLGYPGSTGLQAMDYYLADRHWLPADRFDQLFTEKLVYLPERWTFELHPDSPPVGPLPALTAGHLTFGSFHRLGKITPNAIALWSQLLLALPTARMLLVGIPLQGEQQTLLRSFAAHGIAADRLTLVDRAPLAGYLGLHNQVDIALDTQPYSGATTTLHSLSMGVPTFTVPGISSQARACAGILDNNGLDAFVAADALDLIDKARYWAGHLSELAALRTGMRERLERSPGGQPRLIAAHIEAALRHMWQRWCAGLPPASFDTQLVD